MMFPNAIKGHMPFAPPNRVTQPINFRKSQSSPSSKNPNIRRKTISCPNVKRVEQNYYFSSSDPQFNHSTTSSLSTDEDPKSSWLKPNSNIGSSSNSSSNSSSYENKDNSFKGFLRNLFKNVKPSKLKGSPNKISSPQSSNTGASSNFSKPVERKQKLVIAEKDIRDFLEKTSKSLNNQKITPTEDKSSLHRSYSLSTTSNVRGPRLQSISEEDENSQVKAARRRGNSSCGPHQRPNSDHIDRKSSFYSEINRWSEPNSSNESLHDDCETEDASNNERLRL